MFIVTYFIAVCFVEIFGGQLPEDGEIITPKHVEAVLKIVRMNYRIMHLCCYIGFCM